ncbi:CatB-related O-acetyltransferase [Ketogulonicigenium vulgare]|uniref:CatB-related O-acetyltransferase n=1 Tax=Ketogulonicigenium vulgare TaxID=92945 RepID=UPI0001E66D03|nr:CatB-related O-acetyltransferase [Ketogulonicigenium vulgare]ADO42416.1 putative acetyltransferase [Ketogulonicigenium vulgare Y25]ALJ80789.1 transferase [Ketogulonicigenium vulgare]ANW33573.1 transferase [Ketogulonicigenium vulgare]AOZ54328.1 Bacterial transferase hexapeptide repeat protein [Ketogulonicigenium vulgare]
MSSVEYSATIERVLEDYRIFDARSGLVKEHTTRRRRLKAGNRLHFNPSTTIEEYVTIAAGHNLYEVGAFSSIVSVLPVHARVGRYCSIATGLSFLGFNHPFKAVSQSSAVFNFDREFIASYLSDARVRGTITNDPREIAAPQPERKLIIGHDVWIGENCTFSSSLQIGNGAIVASNSHVVKDVPPYAIVGGNPAKIIRYRFPDEIIARLEASRWWDYELAAMLDRGIDFSNPQNFLDVFESQNDLPRAQYRRLRLSSFLIAPETNAIISHHGGIVRLSDQGDISHDTNYTDSAAIATIDRLRDAGYTITAMQDGRITVEKHGKKLSAQPNGGFAQVYHIADWELFTMVGHPSE